jgi:ATP-dependent RNA helicase DDX51/DBP6
MKVKDSIIEWGLSPLVAANLLDSSDGNEPITSFFPVQQDVIPILLRQNAHRCIQPRDLCVSAPTGSGKTIAFAVPIINTIVTELQEAKLQNNINHKIRLQALIIQPSRELAKQVYKGFCRLAKGTGVKVGLSAAVRSFEEESEEICGAQPASRAHHGVSLDSVYADVDGFAAGPNGSSNMHILVCTPGRLLEHLQFSQGFTLQRKLIASE